MAAFEALVHSKYDVDDTTTNAKQGGKIFGERMELSDIASFEIVAHEKTATTAALLRRAPGPLRLRKVGEMHGRARGAMARVDLEPEELLFHRADASEHFTRDDVGDAMYVVHSGAVVCRVESADVALGPGDHFGERALLYNDTRRTSARRREDTRCRDLREVFEAHLGMLSDILEHNLRTHVLEVALAGRAEDLDLGRLAEAVDVVTFAKGDEIATADEPADHLFVVKSGVAHRVEPAKARPSSNPLARKPKPKLVPVERGGACGEEALDDDADCYASTVVAESESVSCYRLSAAALADEAFRKQYEEVVEPVKTDALSDDDTVEAPQRPSLTTPRRTSVNVSTRSSSSSPAARARRRDRASAVDDFEVFKTLGVGSFGRVSLARHEASHTVCALKVLSKSLVVLTRQARNVKSERDLLLSLRHPLILRCYGTFHDLDCLYLILEVVMGGELHRLLHGDDGNERNRLPLKDAAFYASNVILALKYAHGSASSTATSSPRTCSWTATAT
ncbi:cAMP-dependent protein kinase [Aureococcus anophagefferens]|nr:cAMP-dependent protein kinase [Aureococcus anophagefferens]